MTREKRREIEEQAHRLTNTSADFLTLLTYFKDEIPEARKILKRYLHGHEAGYIASLLTSLYNESALDIFKHFTK